LALEHLKDQLSKDKPQLLEQLGWSRDEARKFMDSWKSRMAAAERQGPEGQAARESLKDALKSLDLRPHSTQLRGGRTSGDQLQNLRDSGQFDPPSEWADQFRAYTRSLSSQKEASGQKADRQAP
jgi:hypothetical protein